jgi:phage/plasmid-associated DNA primase
VFLQDRCVLAPTATSTKKELFESYLLWCEESGEQHRLNMREFGKALQERGIGHKKIKNDKGWIGLRLRTLMDADLEEAPVPAQEVCDVNLDA